MLRAIIATIAIVVSFTSWGQKVTTPDFAYPKTVSANALAQLKKAVKADDRQAIVRSLLDYTMAQGAISRENLPTSIGLIDSVANSASSLTLRAMLLTLQASIYNNVYSAARWKYDGRTLPLSPLPTDCTEWSGEQYRSVIIGLLDKALTDSTALHRERLDSWKKVITQDHETAIYYPTLLDFVAAQALNIYEGWNTLPHTFPMWMAVNASKSTSAFIVPSVSRDPVGEKILELYHLLITNSQRGSASEINSRLCLLDFLVNHAISPSDTPSRHDTRTDLLWVLYQSYLDSQDKPLSEYTGDILLRIPIWGNDVKPIFNTLEKFLSFYPRYWRNDCIRQNLQQMSRKELTLYAPSVTGPGREIELTVEMRNITTATITIYNVSSAKLSKDNYTSTTLSNLPVVAILPINVKGDSVIPFTSTVKVPYRFSQSGNYIAVPSAKGARTGRESYEKIHVTGISLFTTSFLDRDIWAVDANDGSPIADASISINESPYRDGSTDRLLGVTGIDGNLPIASSTHGTAIAAKGTDKYTQPIYLYNYNYTRPDRWEMAATAFTSLPLYHHGDSVQWTAVCYEYKGGLNRPCIAHEVSAVLSDVNGQPVDTIMSITDRYGRAHGTFILPNDGSLSGRFSIMIDGNWAAGFEVSDYKLPTFRVLPPAIENDAPNPGDVTLHGYVKTYSDFPVADAEITVALSVSNGWRGWLPSRSYDMGTFKTTTDSSGNYILTIPADVFTTAPLPSGLYTATVTALSTAGESQQSVKTFSRRQKYLILPTAPSTHNLAHGNLSLEAIVKAYNDSTVAQPVNISVVTTTYNPDTLIRTVASPRVEIDLRAISQGIYTLIFACENADTIRRQITLYNPAAKISPDASSLLWSPTWKLTTTSSGEGEWLYATSTDTHLLTTLWTADSVISHRWIKASKGFNRLPVRLPANLDEATLTVTATGNYTQFNGNIKVLRSNSMRGIKIATETFRDRTVPGEEESWTFRVIDLKGQGREAAIIAGMYNSALDAITSSSWSFTPSRGYATGLRIGLSPFDNRVSHYLNFPAATTRFKCTSLTQPQFNTYGRSFSSYFNSGISSRMMMKRMATGVSADGMETEEIVNTMAVTDLGAARPETAMADTAYGSAAVSIEESAEEEDDNATTTSEDTATTRSGQFSFRDSNVPLAFFRPSLVTDSEGRLSLRFTVPNANTTWKLQLLALTDSLLSTTLSRDIVASKPVMVQPNLPRFIRQGDNMTVRASVTNATDSVLTVKTSIEIFNPTDGKIFNTLSTIDTIASHDNTIKSINFSVPSDMSMIGFRIKSASDLGSDGEQSIIPILPSVIPVIETIPFYIAPDRGVKNVTLPAMTDDSRVTLQLCGNPLWYVVTALPGIISSEAVTSVEAARAIFSASVAQGIVNSNPTIAEALREWTCQGRSSAMLTSMLERNNDLKLMMLNATPWMTDAADDTERMNRLALLFDNDVIKQTLDTNISLLKKLSTPSGGQKWSEQSSEPSQWATNQVITLMGRLASLGYLPQSPTLQKVLISALEWDTAQTLKEFRKHPKGDYSPYVMRHDLFYNLKNGKPSAEIVTATCQQILSSWKSTILPVKALDARILNAHGYPTVARSILASIGQYSESTPEKGMWFPSLNDNYWWGTMDRLGITAFILETYAAVKHDCPEIDALRQWLIMQKGAQNWGTSATATDVIAAVLTTSPRWISPGAHSTVTIDGKLIPTDDAARFTGEYRLSLDQTKVSGRVLTIKDNGDEPAWGAVYCQYLSDMSYTSAASCPELSIEKTIIPDTLSVGTRVTVILTIKSDVDLDYVTINDERAACFEPVDQLPGTIHAEGISFYRVNSDSSTRFFIDRLPRGTYRLTYDLWTNNAGSFTSGIASAQSQYAPRFAAHSSSHPVSVK